MDSSVSSRLGGGLKGVTDAEEQHGDASPSPTASDQQGSGPEESDVAVQGVIQAPQTSVIQSPQVHTVQIASVAELEDDGSVTDSQKRRKILSRRPSYRRILNDLSSDSPAVPKIEEEKTEDEAPGPTSIYQTSSGQYSRYKPPTARPCVPCGLNRCDPTQLPSLRAEPSS